MSFVRRLMSRLLPRAEANEFRVAETASQRLLKLIAGPAGLYGFDFKAIPMKPEIQPMLGFLAAATDVFAHDAGGEMSGPGSINGTMFVLQKLFDERHTQALMESTFQLFQTPTEAFEQGRALGVEFAAAILRQDSETPASVAVHLFSQRYREFCARPDGLDA